MGKKVFEKSLKDWNLEYTEKKSLTKRKFISIKYKKNEKKIIKQ